jgi:pseudoazurin
MTALVLFCSLSFAKTHEVYMLNNSDKGIMAFSPAVLEVSVGDQVKFVPKEMGAHNSVSEVIPAGAMEWAGNPDQEVIVNITQKGVYYYICKPHLPMGMVGFIVVDKDLSNLDKVKQKVEEAAKSIAVNKDRVLGDLKAVEAIK